MASDSKLELTVGKILNQSEIEILASLKNSYDEFTQFFKGKRKTLSTNISDAIDALQVYKKYVYDPTIS